MSFQLIDTLKIAYIYNKGRIERLEKIKKSECPTEFFYGSHELAQRGYTIGYFEIDLDLPPGVVGGVVNILDGMGLCPEKLTGSCFEQARKILKKLREFDVIVATTSGLGFALSFWKIFYPNVPPIVSIHCGLLNHKYNHIRRFFTSALLKRSANVLFGEGELAPLLEICDIEPNKIFVNQFGVDKNFWVPATARTGDYILSVGNDGRRDFETLIIAARNVSINFKILTSRSISSELPPNVSLLSSSWHKEIVSDIDLRSLYQNARCVVISLVESCQPSGQSVALQAMACGCPVILTRTKGLWSNEWLVDGENVIFVPPRDHVTLIEKINLLVKNDELNYKLSRNGRLLTEKEANIIEFAKKLEMICNGTFEN